MKNANSQTLFVISLILAGCGSAWNGYIAQEDLLTSNLHNASGEKVGVSYYLEQPTRRQSAILKTAIEEVVTILNSQQFASAVESYQEWSESPTLFGANVYVDGATVLASLYGTKFQGLQILVNTLNGSTGLTDILPNGCHHGIVLPPSRVEGWATSDDGSQSREALINTLSHELMHVVPNLENGIRFVDTGWKNHPNAKKHLVSYRVGRTAGCVYLVNHRKYSDVKSCLSDRYGM